MKRLLLIAFILTSGIKAKGQSIAEIVAASPELGTLEIVLELTGLDATLDSPGSLTLFAPTDAAFSALPTGVMGLLLEDPDGILNDLLLYHVLGNEEQVGDWTNEQELLTLNGQSLIVTIDGSNVYVNNTLITIADIPADNGMVHVIDAVLMPDDIICTTLESGPYTNFNLDYDGAPQNIDGVCEIFQITYFEAYASESYIADNFEAGREYTFSICDGPNAGAWEAELTVFLPNGNLFAIEHNCSITWTAPVAGSYIIGIQEIGYCDGESPNTSEGNGYPTLSCTGANTVYDIIAASTSHETFQSVLDDSGLNNMLQSPGNFTVFAPTDAAFEAMPIGLLNALQTDPSGVLSELVFYHLLDQTYPSFNLTDQLELMTLLGEEIEFEVDNTITVNDANLIITDLVGSNGIIHVIDAVLIPEENTIYTYVENTANLSMLETAINSIDYDEILDEPGTYTLFAPTNNAFLSLPPGFITAILAQPSLVNELLNYHVLGSIELSSDLVDGPYQTLNGESVNILVDNEAIMVNDAQITIADVITMNGIVHIIDAVLIPTILGVEEVEALTSFSLFPNPTADKLQLNFDLVSSERITIDLLNVTGQLIQTDDFGKMSAGFNRLSLETNQLAAGFYIMSMRIGDERLTQKFQVIR